KGDLYKNLFELFHIADEKYNSGLFDFKQDTITANLIIDNKVIKNIVQELYYPLSPFEFSVFPADILGSVYEQFLGKTIRLTKAHHAKIEEKPEVRKSGGVYYTPKYIVDYIVENTIGKLLKSPLEGGKGGVTPKQIEKIKICDPACGSGSFLIGAYQYLLDWHLKYYTDLPALKLRQAGNPPKKLARSSLKGGGGKKDNPVTPDSNLTTAEKKRILLNNIYGVDIDPQAVEVTKLNLLLKALEGETQASISKQLTFFNERVLPNLGDNIKCGNSLIGNDFYDNQLDLFPEQLKKINAFDWENGFPEIFKQGGFDAVIGNPPWGADFTEEELDYLRLNNQRIIVRMIDSFMYFVYKGSQLLNKQGSLGFILPDVILYQEDNRKLRKYLIENFKLRFIINSGDVFEGVKRPSSILIFDSKKDLKNKISIADISKVHKTEKHNSLSEKNNFSSIYQNKILEIPSVLFVTSNPKDYTLLSKIKKIQHKSLVDFVDEDGIQRGVSPDLKEAFLVDKGTIKRYNLEQTKIRPVLTGGRQVKRYYVNYQDTYLIYTTRNDNFSELPNICRYIDQFKDDITCKEVKQKKHPLYSLHRPRKELIFLKPQKLVGVITEDEIVVSIDENKYYATDGLYLFGVRNEIDIRYITAILNSKLFVFVYRLLALEKGRMLAQVKLTVLNKLPIRTIKKDNPEEKRAHDNIIKLVDNLLMLNKDLQNTKLETQRQQIQRAIQHAENRIDQLVYELYGLSEEEIKIVEDSVK
ncbi:MAG: N-6 DNA methylase, partial [Bacteroidales bacterium]|nr:N-6 DNA methylase [Bacteroidales bacterium]